MPRGSLHGKDVKKDSFKSVTLFVGGTRCGPPGVGPLQRSLAVETAAWLFVGALKQKVTGPWTKCVQGNEMDTCIEGMAIKKNPLIKVRNTG